jgi:O-antigen/teichoic acid export membrane protein
MFPLLVQRHSRGENFKNLLYISLILVLIPSVSITLFYYLFPDFTMKFFLGGGEYLKVGKYLGIFGIFLTIFSLTNVVVNFFLSLNKTKVTYLVACGAAIQIILIYLYHSNFEEVISSSIISCGLLLVMLLLYYVKQYGFHNPSKSK